MKAQRRVTSLSGKKGVEIEKKIAFKRMSCLDEKSIEAAQDHLTMNSTKTEHVQHKIN